MTDMPDLAALLGSRLCHDLISPIGAIGNGVELLSLQGAMDGPELTLIAQSVAHATARIRLFRLAFGMAGANQRVPRGEVQGILNDLPMGGRTRIDWQTPSDMDRLLAKQVLLAVLCLETTLPYSGQIALTTQEDGARVTATSDKLRITPPLWDRLTRPDAAHPPAAPGDVQFALLALSLGQTNRRIDLTLADTAISLRLAPRVSPASG